MYARVTSISGSAAEADAGIESFRANVVPLVREEGKGAILLVDRQSGEAIAITLWEDEEAMRASASAVEPEMLVTRAYIDPPFVAVGSRDYLTHGRVRQFAIGTY